MKILELTFVSGEGGFSAAPLTYTQITRNANFAVYERSHDGNPKDYETFKIKVLPKGHKIFQQVLEDDEERYPSNNSFGKTAWSFVNKGAAMARFAELTAGKVASVEVEGEEDATEVEATPTSGRRGRAPKERVPLTIPEGDFSTNDMAELNKVVYGDAVFFIKEQIAAGKIHFVREERRNSRGKPTRLYKS